MRKEILVYEADGLRMESHFFVDGAHDDLRPGILVFPDAFGLGDHAKDRARRLAGLGYAALACDVHGEGRVEKNLAQMTTTIGQLLDAPERIQARGAGALQALIARGEVDPERIAATGYCFGGTMALELARSGAPIAGAVGFHSGLAPRKSEDAAHVQAKILVLLGADDPGIPLDQRAAFEDEMRAAKADWQMKLYGGVVHSFTTPEAAALGMPDFARYDAAADRRSWGEMIAFFDEIFEKGG